jgi:hypothetical protein
MQSLNNETNPKQAPTLFWRSNHVFFYQTKKLAMKIFPLDKLKDAN